MSEINMNSVVGHTDIAFVVLDSLRYDVATKEFNAGRTPNLAKLLPQGWEKRHSPGSFTYAAHSAFFAGFLPTPADSKASPERLFASKFHGSETTGCNTFAFPEADLVSALHTQDYHSICIGGVGFFNKQSALSRVFPDLFDESHWSEAMGVTGKDSTKKQFSLARELLWNRQPDQRTFLFINISSIHQPNCHYLGEEEDTLDTHAAALRYVDEFIPHLQETLAKRGAFLILCSDHGTLYGEDGFTGHRIGHEAVYTVPYAHLLIESV